MFRRWFQSLGLGGQMTGNALVKPALNVGSKMNELGRHNVVLHEVPGSIQTNRVTPHPGVEMHIACLADRFQYLSVNIL
jgi:hypothetical protein